MRSWFTMRTLWALPPPWQSRRHAIRWSIAAVAAIALWQYVILAASVTALNGSYRSWEVAWLVLKAGSSDFWPGAYGRRSSWLDNRYVQIGPALMAGVWIAGLWLCRSPWGRRLWLAALLLGPFALFPLSLLLLPWAVILAMLVAPGMLVALAFTEMAGSTYRDFAAIAGPSMWSWLSLAIIVPQWRAWRKRRRAERRAFRPCNNCGYSLAGLPGPICPECGRASAAAADPPPSN